MYIIFSDREPKEVGNLCDCHRFIIYGRHSYAHLWHYRGCYRKSSVNSSEPFRTKIATSAVQKRLALIRIFSLLSVAVTVIVIATGLLRTIVHFMLKVWM